MYAQSCVYIKMGIEKRYCSQLQNFFIRIYKNVFSSATNYNNKNKGVKSSLSGSEADENLFEGDALVTNRSQWFGIDVISQ